MTYYIGDTSFDPNYLEHYGILKMKWGVRRYQNKDGTLTAEGRLRYKKFNNVADSLRDERDFAFSNGTKDDYIRIQGRKEAALDEWLPKNTGFVKRDEFASNMKRYLDLDPDSVYYKKARKFINKQAGFDYYKAVDMMNKEDEAKAIVKDFVQDVKDVFA